MSNIVLYHATYTMHVACILAGILHVLMHVVCAIVKSKLVVCYGYCHICLVCVALLTTSEHL